jgi:hypothetical protein
LCSVAQVMTWLPFWRQASAAPLRARLLLSVAPLVQTISRAEEPMRRATCSRAASTAASARQPKACVLLAALPYSLVRYGIIASSTRGSTGVVAL